MTILSNNFLSSRHAELVSASTPQSAAAVPVDKWTLKQVQGDGMYLEASQ